MKAKSELLLYHLLWTAETVMDPTFRNLDASFESWAYRNGFLPQIHRLEAAGLIESPKESWSRGRFVRLTEDGRIAALGGRDPEACWAAPWDKKWRLVLFDLPEKERALRMQVRRALIEGGMRLPSGQRVDFPPCAAMRRAVVEGTGRGLRPLDCTRSRFAGSRRRSGHDSGRVEFFRNQRPLSCPPQNPRSVAQTGRESPKPADVGNQGKCRMAESRPK